MIVEYRISSFLERSIDRCFVTGCIVTGTLRVGCVFTFVATPFVLDAKTHTMGQKNRRQILLQVMKMEWRNKLWQELEAGDTPGLELSGKGVELLNHPDILIAE